jgi:class 3 adenylate cyclase
VSEQPTAEDRFGRLLERLLRAAEASLAAGDVESARSMAEEVRAVDPDNARAAEVLRSAAARVQAHDGERALMTLLFADLVGSTMLSEQVQPEQLRDLFSLYRATAREAVERYGGYVMKYMGDGILAGFGFPDPHEDDARRAVLAAMDMVAAMRATAAGASRPRCGSASTPDGSWSPTSATTGRWTSVSPSSGSHRTSPPGSRGWRLPTRSSSAT